MASFHRMSWIDQFDIRRVWPDQDFVDGKGNKIDLNDQQRTDIRNDAINTGIKMADHTYLWPSISV